MEDEKSFAEFPEYDISSWAAIQHRETMLFGGRYEAFDKETEQLIGYLAYLRVPRGDLLIQHLYTEEPYRNRGVASALLRYMHLDNPEACINPGSRNEDGERFFHYVHREVPEDFDKFLVKNVPLQIQDPVEYWRQAYEDGVIV